MARKLFCVVLLIALAVGMSGMGEGQDLCSFKHCSTDGECSEYNQGSDVASCCQVGKCGAGLGYCCVYG
ncbi:hypothetical protein SUGI_0847070 [Cryptomeria japonica]|nr:hypothetical protein SUGI_0847070 [Cryptomeria japonica]